MDRPFLSLSIFQLEDAFEQAKESADTKTIKLLSQELKKRDTARAQRLAQRVKAFVSGDSPPPKPEAKWDAPRNESAEKTKRPDLTNILYQSQ